MLSRFTNLFFPVCSLVISVFLFILFFSKKKIKNIETDIYSKLITIGLIEASLYCYICLVAHFFINDNTIWIFEFLNKLIYIIYILWFTTLFKYVISILKPKKQELINKIVLGFNIVICTLISILNVEIFYDAATGMSNSSGASSNILYLGISVYLFVMSAIAIANFKKHEYRSKYVPIFILAVFMILGLIVREIDPFLNISSNTLSFVCLVMYFTIENPDMKMVEELVKNKQLAESAFEDKSVYLFKLTQQVREPVDKINNLIKEYKDTDNLENKELIIDKLDNYSRSLNFMINNVMDVSSIDVNNIKLFNTTYNPDKFFLDIKKKTELKIKENPNLNLYFDINRTLPDELYGDPVKLKQVMMSLIENAVKYTDKGIIDINVDGITRYDTCRLVITIKDTGRGMALEDINDILVSNNDLTKEEIEKLDKIDVDLRPSLKIIKLLGGIVNIKSEVDNGTELTIVLDQKVNFSEEKKFLQNIESQVGNIRVLIVDNDNKEINKIVRMLSKKDINTSIAMYGQECVDKIRIGEKYNLIIMDDEMKPDNALPTLQKLKGLKKFNIPVVVMLNKEKEFIKHHYVKDGFTDYILKDNLDKELDRIVNKYL